MGWIAEMKAQQARQDLGTFGAEDWRQFLAVANLEHLMAELVPTLPAFVCNGTVVVNEELPHAEAAWWVWHEIGHIMLHAGSREFWRSRPQGDITVAKFERQASAFAEIFPVWEDGDASFLPCDLRKPNK